MAPETPEKADASPETGDFNPRDFLSFSNRIGNERNFEPDRRLYLLDTREDQEFLAERLTFQKAAEKAAQGINKIKTREQYEKVAWAEFFRMQEVLMRDYWVVLKKWGDAGRKLLAAETAGAKSEELLQLKLDRKKAELDICSFKELEFSYKYAHLAVKYLGHPIYRGDKLDKTSRKFLNEDEKRGAVNEFEGPHGVQWYLRYKGKIDASKAFNDKRIARLKAEIAEIEKQMR